MPISQYFKGQGDAVMQSMRDRYGSKSGEQIFYATANAKKMNPSGAKRSPSPKSLGTKRSGGTKQ